MCNLGGMQVIDERILVIGAGLSGATVARCLAEAGHGVCVVEQAPHPGGHCHTYRDAETGIMIHAHGPHILHSDNAAVWDFVERFATFRPYLHRARAIVGDTAYPLPITLDTINQFFDAEFGPEEARAHLAGLARSYGHEPRNFEEQGRSLIGDALYEAFFHGYTRKQWGVEPERLPASILRRIPVRFTRDPSYYNHSRVAIPEDGYTAMTAAILEHPNIELRYGETLTAETAQGFRHAVYTGPIDAWFGHAHGRLAYRTLDFDMRRQAGDFQPTAQTNYCDYEVPWTRITEYKHFAPWETHAETIYSVETSRDCGPGDTPYYPVRLTDDKARLARYLEAAQASAGVSFVGRLATYRYIDMDVAIAEALDAAAGIDKALRAGTVPAPLFVDAAA